MVCDTCGEHLRIQHDTGKSYAIYICRTYALSVCGWHDRQCTRHSINKKVIEQLVLDELQRVTASARQDREKFIALIRQEQDKAAEKAVRAKRSQLTKHDKRIVELDAIINRLYEDHVIGKVSDERFDKIVGS
jgi:hypothetical protein